MAAGYEVLKYRPTKLKTAHFLPLKMCVFTITWSVGITNDKVPYGQKTKVLKACLLVQA